MLILCRKVGEMIKIGDDIEVVVTGLNSTQVRLGIKAPAAVKVWRKEIYDAKKRQGEANQA